MMYARGRRIEQWIRTCIRLGGQNYNHKTLKRESNLELLRIVAMITIVAHHYVVNSGITNEFDYSSITLNMVFLQLWGMWGKTAINVFVMITGYFMCSRQLTVRRIAKIYMEAQFYTIIIFVLFLIMGYESISVNSIFRVLFWNLSGIGSGFTASFLAFYIFIPFYNKLISTLNRADHLKLICMLLALYTGTSTFFFCEGIFSEPVWYIVLYFVAAYVKIYGSGTWINNNKIIGPMLAAFICLAYASVLCIDFIGSRFGFVSWGYLIADSNKLLAFLVGVSTFLFFNNISIQYNGFINTIASTMFGVLCIHANSSAMRDWLWKKILNVSGMYSSSIVELVSHAVLSIVAIFAVCIMIDLIRIRMIEKPIMERLDKCGWFGRRL